MILLRGGRVVDPVSDVDRSLDVRIEDETIVEVGDRLSSDGGDVIDCSGTVVAPGFVDLHVHLREPGGEDAETIESGSRAAALGGYVAVCPMPNTDPPQASGSVVEYVWRRGREVGLVDVWPVGAITAGRAGRELAPMREMRSSAAEVRLFSDDGDPVPTASLLRRALEYARAFDGVIVEHAEDPSLRDGLMHEGPVSALLGLRGIPAEAEEICVARDVALTRMTRGRLHIAHVSTAQGADAVRRAKADGLAVTAEVTPHHLALTDEAVRSFDPTFKVAPPLRSDSHVAALKAAVADGTIDAVATDHAPHAMHRKDREFEYAPCGMVGLETALGVVLAELVEPGFCTLGRAVELMSSGPARILGKPGYGGPVAAGAPANLVVFDPDTAWTVDAAALASRSRNTPFAGRKLRGRVVHTMLRGRLTVREGALT
ncbi:MAG: dihydroorotase [Actinomycetota bacterium]